MTTNLSRAQPMAMPWSDDIYFFEPDEFEKLFGNDVVQAMVDQPAAAAVGGRRAGETREVLLDPRRHAAALSAGRQTCRSSWPPG